MAGGEEPGDDRAPVMTGHMRRLAPKSLDKRGDVIHQVVDRVALLAFGSVGEPVAA